MLVISSSSIYIVPVNGSSILNKHKHIVLFPLPVFPTIPTFSFEFIEKFMCLRTTSVLGLYFTL